MLGVDKLRWVRLDSAGVVWDSHSSAVFGLVGLISVELGYEMLG